MARPMIGTPEEAAERRRQKTAERVRRLRERRRIESVVQPEPTPAPPPAEVEAPPTRRRTGGIAADRLRSYVERIERLETEMSGLRRRDPDPALADAYAAERRSVQEDIKDVYADAKAAGFTVSVLREVIRVRRMDDEQRALLPLYLEALGP